MNIFINTSIALFCSILTAIITVRLTLGRFYAERWWDRKIESYTKIFDALYSLKDYSDRKAAEDYGTKSLSDEEAKHLGQQWKIATDEVDKVIAIGSFTISADSVKCLKNFRERPRLGYMQHPIFELAKEESKFVIECIDDLKPLAAKDLKHK